jgi:hypothetical protein
MAARRSAISSVRGSEGLRAFDLTAMVIGMINSHGFVRMEGDGVSLGYSGVTALGSPVVPKK